MASGLGVNVAAGAFESTPNKSEDLFSPSLCLLMLYSSKSKFKLPLLPMPREVSASGRVDLLAISFCRMKFYALTEKLTSCYLALGCLLKKSFTRGSLELFLSMSGDSCWMVWLLWIPGKLAEM